MALTAATNSLQLSRVVPGPEVMFMLLFRTRELSNLTIRLELFGIFLRVCVGDGGGWSGQAGDLKLHMRFAF